MLPINLRSLLEDDMRSLVQSRPVTGEFSAAWLTGGTVGSEAPSAGLDDTSAGLTHSGADVGDSRAVLSEWSPWEG